MFAVRLLTVINDWTVKEIEMERQILIIKGNEAQSVVARILFESGYTVRQITVTPKNSKTKTKALEYWKGEEK